ncbi:site-specific integrase [Variovorax boronicumulans]|uniref:site-specific integrase n=1 Tax=Variovorax boronicumulans TaxID=436515 RepID=UPI0012E6ACFD|nr:site-specific integrase [Variovorax boronicumulans]GER18442.1 hypothetical protein VCH24_34690 [Variovorax boronicumulans]
MNTMRKAIGNTLAEWREDEPLRWAMRETKGQGKHAVEEEFIVDFTALLAGYSQVFLLALKDVIVNRRLRVSLRTVEIEQGRIRRLFEICHDHFVDVCKQQALAAVQFDRVSPDFLLGLAAVKSKIPAAYLIGLRSLFVANRQNGALFSPDLQLGDFPTGENNSGEGGQLRKNVLISAMSRSALVQILNITEAAFAAGELSLGRYAFSRLLLSRAARPETYRVLRCKDLRVDTSSGVKSYFLDLTIPKTRMATRPRATVSIRREVGQLLEKQREAVATRLRHLVETRNALLRDEQRGASPYTIGDLPLFPTHAKQMDEATNARLGMLASTNSFNGNYVMPLRKMTGKVLTCTAMRHTLGTQMAIAGCSSITIAAVLLHATNETAKVYVDLIFEGAIDELSDSMEDAFLEHFPVFKDFVSVRDITEPAKRVQSESLDRTSWKTTGECGRDQICQYAPIVCYECPKFKPCYDVDHTINLDLVHEEINAARSGGLQRQTDMKRYSHIANRIRIVINVCELKRAAIAVEQGRAKERP